MKKGLGNKGFTLIELLITVAILAILASILVPSYTQYVASSKAKVCEVNRLEFVHSFKVYKVFDSGNYTLADAVDGKVSALSAEKTALNCPSGGMITATDTSIDCSIHGSLPVDLSGVGGSGTGNGNPSLPNGEKAGSWKDYFEYANKNYSLTIKRGQVLEHNGEYFTFKNQTNITVSDGEKFKEDPSGYAEKNSGLIKLDFTKVHDQYTTDERGQLTWEPPLTKGALFVDKINKKTYVCVDNIGANTWQNGIPGHPSSEGSVWNLLNAVTDPPQK